VHRSFLALQVCTKRLITAEKLINGLGGLVFFKHGTNVLTLANTDRERKSPNFQF
jgi:hypothetical protein